MITIQPSLLPSYFRSNHPEFCFIRAIDKDKRKTSTKSCRSPGSATLNGLNCNGVACNNHIVHSGIKYYVIEHDDSFQVDLDVPGVEKSDIQVEMVNRAILKVLVERKVTDLPLSVMNFQQKLLLDEKTANTSDIRAQLEDGVLKLIIPKKQQTQAVDVQVNATYPPDNATRSNTETFYATLDLPGVPLGNLEVKLQEGILRVVAKRDFGEKKLTIHKKMIFDDDQFDATKVQAYLVDGVLTISAPNNENHKQHCSNQIIEIQDSEGKELHPEKINTSAFIDDTNGKDDEITNTGDENKNNNDSSIRLQSKEEVDTKGETLDEKIVVETVDEQTDEWVELSSD